jgi:predicted transcriptional regulator
MAIKKEPKAVIMDVLEKHPEGLTLHSVAKFSNMNRLTATKYIHELLGEGKLYQRMVGKAKLCYLKDKYMQLMKEGEVIEEMKKLK